MSHTSGPWKVNYDVPDASEFYISADVRSSSGPWKLIATVEHTNLASAECTAEEIEANAKLIAAAPELLEALRPFAAMEILGDENYQIMAARAAIAKAEDA